MKRAKPDNNNIIDEGDDVERRAAFCFASQETPACLSREFNKMPLPSREQVGHDVFGIPTSSFEIPDNALEEMQQELSLLGNNNEKKTSAYELALELDSDYATSPKLLISFLRAVEGQPKRAATRMVRHFETKLDLFGRDKLVKDIEISDLDEYDMEALRSGGFQVLPKKDRAGRPILFGRYTCMKYRQAKNMLRVLWYIWSSIVEDDDHQKSGIISIGYEIGRLPLERFQLEELEQGGAAMFDMHESDGGFDRDLARGILSIPLSLPIRPLGYHICADNTQWQGISDMVMATLCKYLRLRMRFHYGTNQECQYALMTHGLPIEAIPVNSEGDVDLTQHYEWIENRLILEASRQGVDLMQDS